MELIFGNRYEVRRTVRELRLGTMYEAFDRSLSRSVLLYEIAPERTTTDSRETVKRGASFTHDRFMHILDVGTEKGMPYAVFKACEGSPLVDELHRHRLRPQQLLTAVYELGKAMQDAAEEGMYGFSVCADNLWLGSGAAFMPIHYWDAADERRRGAAGLCHLLYQLAARTDELPDHADTADNRLRIALRALPPETLEALLALYRRVFREKLSLTAFLLELHVHIQGAATKEAIRPAPAAQPQTEKQPQQTQPQTVQQPVPRPQPQHIAAPRSVPERKAERPAPVQAAASPLEETKKFQAVAEPAASGDTEPEENGASADRRSIWKKIAIISGAACLFVIVFVGGLMLIFQVANPSESDRTAAKDTAPASPSTAAPTPAPKQPDTGNAAADKTVQTVEAVPTTIPQLVGLSKADAEKRALASGLHYTFYIEKDNAAKDTVFKQEPKAGDPAVKGGSVTFWVSKGN